MKKGISKVIYILICLSLISVGVLGCGSQESSEPTNEILLGGNYELTGGLAAVGKQTVNGINLAIKQANANGGVLGKQIKFIVADNKSEPSEAANAVTKLINTDRVKLVFGSVASSNVLAAVQIAEDTKVPLITATATNPTITVNDGKVRNYIFRTCFIDPFQGQIMANFALNTLQAQTAAIYVDSSSDYSKGLATVFEQNFTKQGGKVLVKEAFLQKDQDFKATLTKIKALNPDVLFIPAYYEEVGKILKQANELGIKAKLLGTDGWDDPKLIEIAGVKAVEGAYFSNHYSPQDTDPNVVKFVESYRAEYQQEPSALAVLGYDAALVVIDAIKRAGSDDPEKIRQALAETKKLQITTGLLSIDENHNAIKPVVVVELKDGKQIFKEKIIP
ncbi:ABC transporter substrate-binding protein [Anaerosinus massiliensis]|uniref:ABC transporter substrate-binding protein n=1 Tax=Massilibacillus massiliensis TaxID=1806837 RepID=UPI000A54A4D7|nr:ABC transporter substrate-binding protein [Massilibacillus massiliensis]